MGRLAERLGLTDVEYCPYPLPNAGLDHAEARDRKIHGRSNGHRRFAFTLLEQALAADSTTSNPTGTIGRERLMMRALRGVRVDGLEIHPALKKYAKKIARRDPPRHGEWEGFFKTEWVSCSISLRQMPENPFLANGQGYLSPADPFMARFFEYGASAIKQLARYLTGERIGSMSVHFAAGPIKVDKSVKNPKPEYEWRALDYPARVEAEGVKNSDVREVFDSVNRRGDGIIPFARVDTHGQPVLFLSYLPHDLSSELKPKISEADVQRIHGRRVRVRGMRSPRGDIKIRWRQNGISFNPGQLPRLLLIDRAVQEQMLRHPDFIPATAQDRRRTFPTDIEIPWEYRLLQTLFPNSPIVNP